MVEVQKSMGPYYADSTDLQLVSPVVMGPVSRAALGNGRRLAQSDYSETVFVQHDVVPLP